jgi:hypothetical protein
MGQRLRWLCVAPALLLLTGSRLCAQLVSPSSHWGSITLPDLHERRDLGLHFVSFTRYGKEVFPGTETYTFEPYNDMTETLGLNLLTYSRMLTSVKFLDGQSSVDLNTLSKRQSFIVGVIDDNIPEWLQNDVVHWSRLSDKRLRRVPRNTTDSQTSTSKGTSKPVLEEPILGISEEYFLRLSYTRRLEDQRDQRVPTPFFVGGGWSAGTLNQEVFLHAGASVANLRVPRVVLWGWVVRLGPEWLRIQSLGAGGMWRIGLLHPGLHFDDLSGHYSTVQGVLRLEVSVFAFPVQLEAAGTSASGFFVAARPDSATGDRPRETEYQSKTLLNERFIALRLRIGDFTFETFNDTFGGKDKGPSFGAHAQFNVLGLNRRLKRGQ